MMRSATPRSVLVFLCAGLLACGESTTGTVADAPAQGDVPDASGADADTSEEADPGSPGDDGPPPEDPGDQELPEPTECSPGVSCDDGLACTVDACTMPGEVCAWTLMPDFCLINNICISTGEAKKGSPCEICAPETDASGWSPQAEGSACDPEDACVEGANCAAGSCEGSALQCQDDTPCTTDTCDPAIGCVYTPVEGGLACDDSSPCTMGDQCLLGFCMGLPVLCDDSDPCTADLCDPELGCQFEPTEGPCEDGDPCTDSDTCNAGSCVGGEPTDCSDTNPCTIDFCEESAGCIQLPTESPCCQGLVSVCDDADPCTLDTCDPVTTECSYEFSTTACDDGSVCTTGDTCIEGDCVGAELSCDDADACTLDACEPGTGCLHAPATDVPCDDGLECSTDDVCFAGVCVADTSACVCEPKFQGDFAKVNSLAIGTDGKPGNGLDVDGNPTTCSPADDCEGGIDNSFAALAGLANPSLADAIGDGDVMLIFDAPPGASGELEVFVYQGDLDPTNADCDHLAAVCEYVIDGESFDTETCAPLFTLGATIDGEKLSGGGAGSSFPFAFPVQGIVLDVTVYMVQLEGTLSYDASGNVTGFDGILAGALTKANLSDAIDATPEDELPLPKETIIALLDSILAYDIDTDSDGVMDAASVGFQLSAIDAKVSGVD